jgi:hypothetical protein
MDDAPVVLIVSDASAPLVATAYPPGAVDYQPAGYYLPPAGFPPSGYPPLQPVEAPAAPIVVVVDDDDPFAWSRARRGAPGASDGTDCLLGFACGLVFGLLGLLGVLCAKRPARFFLGAGVGLVALIAMWAALASSGALSRKS